MGLYRDNGKENGNYRDYIGFRVYWGYIGIMEKKMETTTMGLYRDYRVYYWGYIGIMENQMETTMMGLYRDYRVYYYYYEYYCHWHYHSCYYY